MLPSRKKITIKWMMDQQAMSELIRSNIKKMKGYSWGEQPASSTDVIKLNTNENAYPPSAEIKKLLKAIELEHLRAYPVPMGDELRDAIAKHHGLAKQNIVLTNGGDEGLRLAMTTLVDPLEVFSYAEPSYSLYPVLASIQNATIRSIPYAEDWLLPTGFAEEIESYDAKLTCIVNPHAPSGALYDTEQISKIAEKISGVLLIDEAYADFVDPKLNYNSFDLINRHDNILILRSFSKGYSLAGLRLAYLAGNPELIETIANKTRDSYNVGYIQQMVGLAAIKDQSHASFIWSKVRENREHLRTELARLGLSSPQTQSNFILATVGNSQEVEAKDLYLRLKEKKIFIRHFQTAHLKDKIRVTVGTPEQNSSLIKEIERILG